jgi:diguanylate cyclase (GGDEF)-like protein/PAS domain S-box-containing protein
MEPETILIVDDNRQIADFCATKLLPEIGFNARVAYTAQQAFEMIQENSISLLLLDLHLPDMTGFDLLKKLSEVDKTLPTILITAEGSEQIAADAFRLGVEDYLPKPIDADKLALAVNRVLTQARLREEKERLTFQLKEQVALHAVLSRVGRSITSSLNLDEVLLRIVEAGVYLTRAEEGFLALHDQQTDQLYLRAVKNIDEEKSKTIRLPANDSLVGQVYRTGKSMRVRSNSTDHQLIKVSTGYLVQSVLHVPIASKGRPLGVLSVVNHINPNPFKERDETLLLSLADYAAIALENAQLYRYAEQEILERKRAEAALRESEERYALAVRGANDGIWDWDLKTNRVYYSPRWKAMLGYEESAISQSIDEWISRVHPEDVEHLKVALQAHIEGTSEQLDLEYRIQHKDGTYRWILCRGLTVRDASGKAYRLAGSQSDITDRKYAEEKLLHDAFYDLLTGLPNRALFKDHLGLAVERVKRKPDYRFAVLFLDLDRFKDVNDTLGHGVGDELLASVARKLEKRMRSTDTVARFGGDEFVILIEDFQEDENAIQLAEWIIKELAEPFKIKHRDVFINASIGIVLSSVSYKHGDEVLRDADIAMYNAKSKGKGRYEVFTPSMREDLLNRTEMEHDLRRAIDNNELYIHYQTIVSLQNEQVVGVEALVRWKHPRRGFIPPNDFIPLAEETDLITQIDRWVMRQACLQLQEWRAKIPGAHDLTVSVNLSSKDISKPDLIEYIKSVLEESGLQPCDLKLEITESAILENTDLTSQTFDRLRDLGVQLQIDDFGTGYSALSYLSNFPIDALKIDQSFIRSMAEDDNNTKIVQAILMLSDRLDVGVIAEGIENEKLFLWLKDLGCEYGQGYYISRPLEPKLVTANLVEKLRSQPGRVSLTPPRRLPGSPSAEGSTYPTSVKSPRSL